MNIAVLFAGGVGSRMKAGSMPKQFLQIHGKPIIIHTLEHFEAHSEIDAVAVAILPEWRNELEKLIHRFEIGKVRWIVDGGSTGQESRHRALQAVALESPLDSIVLIHDGVRPLIDEEIISKNIALAREKGNAITCTKINETIIISEEDQIDGVVPRESLYAARAPQTFKLGEILALYDRVQAEGETDTIDSCSIMNRYGLPIFRVDGPHTNIKVTTGDDLHIARTFFDVIENRELFGS